jgi:hypothetical protein
MNISSPKSAVLHRWMEKMPACPCWFYMMDTKVLAGEADGSGDVRKDDYPLDS